LEPKRLVKPNQLEAGTRRARLRRNIPNDSVGLYKSPPFLHRDLGRR
jgi:hypothetical protein